ncbi:MAG: hypothetical protein P8Z71_00485 [Candidatus Sulfobium sp.]|jgi:hypothetical protein
MQEKERFQRWRLKEEDLKDLNPAKAKDLIIHCFYEAQKETFARSKQTLGLRTDEAQVFASVLSAIKLAFKETGEDFNNPTKKNLTKVVEVLGRKATSWGTPRDIIEYHRGQIMRVIGELK